MIRAIKSHKSALAGLAFACLTAGFGSAAQAALITFEGQLNQIYSAPITRLGFDIGNVAGDQQHFHELTSTQFGLPNNGTGVLLNDRNTRIFVEEQSDADFSLGMVDVASALDNGGAVGLNIEGFLNGISTGVITISTLGSGYTTVNGGALGTIDRLVFEGIGSEGGFVLDNLLVNDSIIVSVPEPGSLALVGLAFAALGFTRRKRSRD